MTNQTTIGAPMTCLECQAPCQRFGQHRNGLRRYRCRSCKRTFTQPHERTLGTMYISPEKAALAIRLLVEGNSIRSTERICGLDRNTIMSLLVKAGERCERLMREKMVNLPVQDVECDEIWGYCGKKENHIRPGEESRWKKGDAYCFIAVERTTKAVLCWHLGKRNRIHADIFIGKLRHAVSEDHFQLSTDGFGAYTPAVTAQLRGRCDYGQIVKVYGQPRDGEQRYSPAEVIGMDLVPVMGDPDMRMICTSHIERQNLTIRMGMRRMTRLTNAFSKKWDNLEAAYALHFAYYNFCRVHQSLKKTPAMAQGITDHVWTIAELIA